MEWNGGVDYLTGLLEGCGRRLWRMRIAGTQLAIRPRVFGVREARMVRVCDPFSSWLAKVFWDL